MTTEIIQEVVIPVLNRSGVDYVVMRDRVHFRVGDRQKLVDLRVSVVDIEADDPALVIVADLADIAPDDREETLVTYNNLNTKIRGKVMLHEEGKLRYAFDVELGSANGADVFRSALEASLSLAATYYIFHRSKDLWTRSISRQVLDDLREVIDNDDSAEIEE